MDPDSSAKHTAPCKLQQGKFCLGKETSPWQLSHVGTCCPERLWNLFSWKYSKFSWTNPRLSRWVLSISNLLFEWGSKQTPELLSKLNYCMILQLTGKVKGPFWPTKKSNDCNLGKEQATGCQIFLSWTLLKADNTFFIILQRAAHEILYSEIRSVCFHLILHYSLIDLDIFKYSTAFK